MRHVQERFEDGPAAPHYLEPIFTGARRPKTFGHVVFSTDWG